MWMCFSFTWESQWPNYKSINFIFNWKTGYLQLMQIKVSEVQSPLSVITKENPALCDFKTAPLPPWLPWQKCSTARKQRWQPESLPARRNPRSEARPSWTLTRDQAGRTRLKTDKRNREEDRCAAHIHLEKVVYLENCFALTPSPRVEITSSCNVEWEYGVNIKTVLVVKSSQFLSSCLALNQSSPSRTSHATLYHIPLRAVRNPLISGNKPWEWI